MGIITASRALSVTPQSGVGGLVNTASASFNGTTQYAGIPNASFPFNHQIFAISAFIRRNASGVCHIFSQSGSTTATAGFALISYADGGIYFEGRNSTPVLIFAVNTPTGVVTAGTWHHVFAAYNGSNGTGALMVDGVDYGGTFAADTVQIEGSDLHVGYANPQDLDYFNGLIDEVSIFSGTIPAVTDLRDSTTGQPKDLTGLAGLHAWWRMENDWLDSSGNGRNLTPVGSPTFSSNVPPQAQTILHLDSTVTDTGANQKVWTAGSGATSDTVNKKFGTGSYSFDGTVNSYVSTPDNADFDFGTGDFTIDLWVNIPSGSVGGWVMGKASTSTVPASFYWGIAIAASNISAIFFRLYLAGSGYIAVTPPTLPTADGVWHHHAITRSGGTLRYFIDGVVAATSTGSNSTLITTNQIRVGQAGEYTTDAFQGKIDEVRILKGTAVWTSNFTPPSAPYANPPVIWQQLLSGATARDSHSAAVVGTSMYVFGGLTAGTRLNTLWEYNALTNVWAQKTTASSVRVNHTASAIGTNMYVFGGYDAGSAYLNELWQYDTLTNTWTQLTSGSTGRNGHSSVVFGTDMYIFGGWNASSFNDLWKYDSLLNIWTQLASGALIRQGHSAVAIGTDMFIFGGFDVSIYNDLWKYDTLLNTWTQLTSGATPRYSHSAVAVGTDMFVFGGYDGGNLNDLWKYNTLTDAWSQLTSGSTIRNDHSAVAIGTDMYIFGGTNGADLADLWKYNTLV